MHGGTTSQIGEFEAGRPGLHCRFRKGYVAGVVGEGCTQQGTAIGAGRLQELLAISTSELHGEKKNSV